MADNDQNDEYKFDELDSIDNDPIVDADYDISEPKLTEETPTFQKNIKRNALITIGAIVFIMVLYKLLGSLFSGKNDTEVAKGQIPPAPVAQAPPAPQPIAQPAVISQSVAPEVQQALQESNAVKQKVDSMEMSQQNIQSQVSSMNEQVININNNVTNLSTQIDKLNQTVSDLTNQVSKQSEEINVLMVRTKPRPVRQVIHHHQRGEVNIYYINAIIPGRAWLIGTNGSTLTVREGTRIAGYGIVKLIDSMQGRVLTSSGRIIRFSQEDS